MDHLAAEEKAIVTGKESEKQGRAGEAMDEPLVRVQNLSFSYPEAPEPMLKEISFSLYRGEMVVLSGPSGCGKSTLCRHLNGIIPHLSSGEILGGEVLVDGMNVARTPVHALATRVGMVHQNPESQIVCLEVKDELAFGPENIGLTHEEIVERVTNVIDWVQLHNVADSLTFACSGGQKQRVALGSSLALLPDLLVLDEPTTDLDPVGAQEVVETIAGLRDRLGLTFLIVEHDLSELLEVADRMIVMDGGRIVFDANPEALIHDHYEALLDIGLRIPEHIVVSRRLNELDPASAFSIRRQEGIDAFRRWARRLRGPVVLPEEGVLAQQEGLAGQQITEAAIAMKGVTFSYDGGSNVVEDVDLEIPSGQFVAVVGANGSGKSTLARLILGLLQPQEGTISVLGADTNRTSLEAITARAGYLFQNPDAQLFNTSVEAEVAFGMRVRGVEKREIEERVTDVLNLLGLQQYREQHPFSLSRGERQRLALATVLVTDPDLIILDEPTTGQDRRMLENLIDLMRQWIARKQATVLMIAHDMNLVCQHADRTIVMERGCIVCDDLTEKVFIEHFDRLREMKLLPPALVEMSYPIVGTTLSRALLSLQEFEWLLSSQKQAADGAEVAFGEGKGDSVTA